MLQLIFAFTIQMHLNWKNNVQLLCEYLMRSIKYDFFILSFVASFLFLFVVFNICAFHNGSHESKIEVQALFFSLLTEMYQRQTCNM